MLRLALFSGGLFTFFAAIFALSNSILRVYEVSSPQRLQEKRDMIKQEFLSSYRTYRDNAWGYDFLLPQTLTGKNACNLSYTITDNLDSFLLFGDISAYEEAVAYISNLHVASNISVFESTIRALGSLIASYERTSDFRLMEVAAYLGDHILQAFDTDTGLPHALLDTDGTGRDHPWARGCSILADVGSLHLEFMSLSHYTGNPKYAAKIKEVLAVLRRLGPIPPTQISYASKWPCSNYFTVDALGDSYFECLLKLYLYDPVNGSYAKEEFESFVDEAISRLGKTSVVTGMDFFGSVRNGTLHNTLSHLFWFLPGNMILGSKYLNNATYLDLGLAFLDAGMRLYDGTRTGIGGEEVTFTTAYPGYYWANPSYKLRPELVESLFYAWRVTHNPKYRVAGWRIFEAIRKYCKVNGGYTTIRNVDMNVVEYGNMQESFFLSETLKYLYLLFSPDSLYDLDDYIFTTQAHPIRRLNYV